MIEDPAYEHHERKTQHEETVYRGVLLVYVQIANRVSRCVSEPRLTG